MADTPLSLTPENVGGTPVYLTGEDQLRVTAFTVASGLRAQLSGRLLNTAGRIVPFTFDYALTGDRTAQVMTRAVGDGWVLEASVRISTGTPQVGIVYAVLSLVRGQGGGTVDLSTLAAGVITSNQRIAWPGGAIQGSCEGPGSIRSFTGATPAAGAEISETVPTGARWELIALLALLTTSATVATRLPLLRIDDGANMLTEQPAVIGLAASLALRFGFAQGVQNFTLVSNGTPHSPLPAGNRLVAGYRIRTNTVNIQAADQWSAVQYVVREWQEAA